MSERTMVHYWDRLSPQELRLIHDLLRANVRERKNLPMGLLPFVPVQEVIDMLRSTPASPWTEHLISQYYGRDRTDYIFTKHKQEAYKKSYVHDKADYSRIINILTTIPSKLAAQLERWQEYSAKGPE